MTSTFHLDLGHGISRIDSGYYRTQMAAFYMLVEGDRVAFIDSGTSHSVPRALDVLRAKGFAPEQVAYVIPTHVHLDHAGGVGEMMRQFPNAQLVVHPRGARHMIDPSKLMAGVLEVYGAEAAQLSFGELVPVPEERVIQAPDNFTLDLNGRELLFLDTPGHARHHFCIYDARAQAIFSGDTFGASYRELDTERGAFIVPTTTPVQFEPERLHASIDRLLSYRPQQILLTHFGRVTEIERLAADMHASIDAFVELGRRTHASGNARHQLLVDGQRNFILPRLRSHGCRLSDNEIESVLEADFELNAQGIGVWLDRPAAAH